MDSVSTERAARPQQGFTLIELMIVVVVIAILAAIAYPNYMNSVRKANRAEAKSALTSMAGRQEQHFLNNKRYASSLTDLGWSTLTENDLYDLTDSSFGTLAYSLVAKPNRAPQTGDDECMNFTLDQLGNRGISGTGDAEDCW